MNFPWFRRYGLLFIPVKFPGWLLLIQALTLAVFSFIRIDRKSHSVSDTLINFFFYLLIIIVVYSLFGLLAGKNPGKSGYCDHD